MLLKGQFRSLSTCLPSADSAAGAINLCRAFVINIFLLLSKFSLGIRLPVFSIQRVKNEHEKVLKRGENENKNTLIEIKIFQSIFLLKRESGTRLQDM